MSKRKAIKSNISATASTADKSALEEFKNQRTNSTSTIETETTKVGVKFPKSIHGKLKKFVKAKGWTIAGYIKALIDKDIQRRKQEGEKIDWD